MDKEFVTALAVSVGTTLGCAYLAGPVGIVAGLVVSAIFTWVYLCERGPRG